MTPPTTVVISLDLMSLVGSIAALFVFFGTVVFGFGKMLVKQFNAGLASQFTARDEKLTRLEGECKEGKHKNEALEQRFHELLAQLPLNYVQREDWIRFSTSIDSKLDSLRRSFQKVSESVAGLVASTQARNTNGEKT